MNPPRSNPAKRIGPISGLLRAWPIAQWYKKCTAYLKAPTAKLSKAALCAGLLFSSLSVQADLNDAQKARYDAWINELRCLVCQNQTIAESNAPLAADLRQQVSQQIEAGRSDDEIRRYVTERYGDFVLYNPPLKSSTWLLWFAPFVLLALALALVVRWLMKSKGAQ